MYKYAFFDLDGTLTQSEFGIVAAVVRALTHFGIDTQNKEILKKFIGPPLYVSFHDLYGFSEEKTEEAIRIYRDYYAREGVFQAPLYDGVKEMLAELKKSGCRLVITTSKPEKLALTVAEIDGITDFFDGIIGPKLDEHNPNKAILIRRAMQKLELTESDLERMIVVGDRFYDIEAANEIGIDSIGVLYGYGNEDELSKAGAVYIVKDVKDIARVILSERKQKI